MCKCNDLVELQLFVGMFFVDGRGGKLANLMELLLFVGMFFVEGLGVNE